jgi:hypothetical protein
VRGRDRLAGRRCGAVKVGLDLASVIGPPTSLNTKVIA